MLSGQNQKKKVSFVPLFPLDSKENTPNIEICPEYLVTMQEYSVTLNVMYCKLLPIHVT